MRPWDDIIPESDKKWYRHYLQGDLTERPLRGGARPAIIVVDMSNAFVDSHWPTGCSDTGIPCAQAIKRLLDVGRSMGVPSFFTTGYARGYKPTPAELGRWVGNVMGASPTMNEPRTHDIYELIKPVEGEVIIYKGARPSAFFGTNLISMLNFSSIDTAIVTGILPVGWLGMAGMMAAMMGSGGMMGGGGMAGGMSVLGIAVALIAVAVILAIVWALAWSLRSPAR